MSDPLPVLQYESNVIRGSAAASVKRYGLLVLPWIAVILLAVDLVRLLLEGRPLILGTTLPGTISPFAGWAIIAYFRSRGSWRITSKGIEIERRGRIIDMVPWDRVTWISHAYTHDLVMRTRQRTRCYRLNGVSKETAMIVIGRWKDMSASPGSK